MSSLHFSLGCEAGEVEGTHGNAGAVVDIAVGWAGVFPDKVPAFCRFVPGAALGAEFLSWLGQLLGHAGLELGGVLHGVYNVFAVNRTTPTVSLTISWDYMGSIIGFEELAMTAVMFEIPFPPSHPVLFSFGKHFSTP